MQLRYKIVLLAVLPLLLAVTGIGSIMVFQAQRLAETQIAAMEENFLASRRAELKHNVALALSSIAHLYQTGRDDYEAKNEAMQIGRRGEGMVKEMCEVNSHWCSLGAARLNARVQGRKPTGCL